MCCVSYPTYCTVLAQTIGVMYIFIITNCHVGLGETECELLVHVSSLHFTHHPLFSVEHVLASKLQQACNQLSKRQRAKTQDYYLEKVCVICLRETLENLSCVLF